MNVQSARTQWAIDRAVFMGLALVATGVIVALLRALQAGLSMGFFLVIAIVLAAFVVLRGWRQDYKFIHDQITDLLKDGEWHTLDFLYLVTHADDELTMSDVTHHLERRKKAGQLQERVAFGEFEFRNTPV